MAAANSSVKGTVYFPSYEELLDFLQKHPSTRNEPTEVKQMAARYFGHFSIQKPRTETQIGNQDQTFKDREIQKRVNDFIGYELIRSNLPDNKIGDTCTKLKTALGECLNGKPIE